MASPAAPVHVPLLTRSAIAKRAGVSKSQIRRLETKGELQPTIGPNGVRLYGEEIVERVSRRRTLRAERDRGVVASEVFSALDAGTSAKDIVIRQCVEPNRIEELRRQHATLQGGLFLGRGDVEKLMQVLGMLRLGAARDLVGAVEERARELAAARQQVAQQQAVLEVFRSMGFR